jgi:hypothetical protein
MEKTAQKQWDQMGHDITKLSPSIYSYIPTPAFAVQLPITTEPEADHSKIIERVRTLKL